MGMLATVINGLALQSSLEKIGLQTRLQTAINMGLLLNHILKEKLFVIWRKKNSDFLVQEPEIHSLLRILLLFFELLKLKLM